MNSNNAALMNIPPAKLQHQPNEPTLPVIVPNDLITEVLSLLPVKSLMRLRCLRKSWNSLISDPTFIKMHLKRSTRNAHLVLVSNPNVNVFISRIAVPFPVCRLLENPLITLPDDLYYNLKENDCIGVVGSCNGLLCLLGFSAKYREIYLRFWNVATRTISKKLGSSHLNYMSPRYPLRFTFGYDDSTDTYKVAAFCSGRRDVRIFSLGDNVWRTIQLFPVAPLRNTYLELNDGVHLTGTFNWLAIHNKFTYEWRDITVKQFVIISLDLATEKYTQLMLPRGFDEVPPVEPNVSVLMDCLCFSHDFKRTDFVIWQMKIFGVEESWTRLLKISYQNLVIHGYDFHWFPLHLSRTADILILANQSKDRAILYNLKDNRVQSRRTRITDEIWWLSTKNYVESLVSPC